MSDPASTPKTEHNFIEMEKKWLQQWYEKGLVKKYLTKNDNATKYFSFQDGPITANNPMGVHHAWGRTYKDLWQRFHNLLGYKQRFQNGFDCQGLWVEVEVEKELGLKSKKDIENLVPGDKAASIAKFVQLCRDRVLKFSAIQTEQTKRLGNFMDWEHSYFTMSDENNYMIWHFLKTCHEHGWIYKGRDSVPWCPRCETAISQHEMLTEDYKELVHETIYFKLRVVGNESEKDPVTQNSQPATYLLAWTTTPWTVPGNVALAVNPQFDYVKVKVGQDNSYYVILGKNRLQNVFKEGEYEIVEEFKGDKLLGLHYEAPFDELPRVQAARDENPDTFHSVVNGEEIVTESEGTGVLHVAPGQGKEDFDLGKKEKLSLIELIDDTATYYSDMNDLTGKNAKKHPELIIDFLKTYKNGEHLLKTEQYKHRYPACWRCKTELVWRVAEEWYIAMDKPSEMQEGTEEGEVNPTLRERMVEVALKITWMPEFGLDRELDWLKNMHDWLISKKNRYWGLALPIFECEQCGHFEVIGSKEELKELAVEGWDKFEGKTPHKPYIDEVVIKCDNCGEKVKRVNDVGNVWLDAGIVPFSTIAEHNQGQPLYLKNREEWRHWFPIDFITESFPGQFKNWFYALIAMSTALENTNPFKTVLGFGTMLGEDGRPMHKSWGNYIEFNEGADKIGVDVMRWMFSRQNPADNMLFGYKKADEVRRQFYLLLWNIYKYYKDYAVLDNYKITGYGLRVVGEVAQSGNILDIWILNRFYSVINAARKNMHDYNAKDAALAIEQFVIDLSTWYIRRSRNRVWTHAESEDDKKSFYATMSTILVNLSVVISPFMPFISEEMYTTLTGNESVHLAEWPHTSGLGVDNDVIDDMQLVRTIAEAGNRIRKEIKIKVRQPLASITVGLPKDTKFKNEQYKAGYEKLLKDELNVKKIEWTQTDKETLVAAYDTNLTDELKAEGEVRDLMRQIQQERKTQGIQMDASIKLIIPEKFKQFAEEIKKTVQANVLEFGDSVHVEKS